MSNTPKRNLVIVRAGKKSLHGNWIIQPHKARTFDLIVSYFDEEAFQNHIPTAGVDAYFYKGGKWDGLYHTISNYTDIFDRYDYVWLPDDDIHCTSSDIDQIFNAMRINDIKVGQPSLSANSYFTHFLLLNCPTFKLRYSNFIEVMVPCLRIDVLHTIYPRFEHSMSGFGLDYVWCRLASVGRYGAAIFDSIEVHHTRPVGKVLLNAMSKDGRNPKDEERILCDMYGVEMNTTPIAYAGLTHSDELVEGTGIMALRMFRGYVRALNHHSPDTRTFGFSKITQMVRRQLTRPCDISTRTYRVTERGTQIASV